MNIEEVYGKPGTNLEYVVLPYKMKLAWDTKTIVSRFLCNKKIKENVFNIFTETLKHYTLDGVKELRLDLFGGCYNNRVMRGGTQLSTHAYGLAIDIDPENNQLKWGKDKATLAKKEYEEFWKIVERNGGYSLGRLKNYDWMHFQFIKP